MTNQNQLIHLLLALALPVILLVAAFLYTHNSPRIAHAAATISVTGTADDSTVGNLDGNGTCDLREAIQAANTNSTVGECVHDGSTGTETMTFNISGALAWAHTPLCSLLP